MSEASKADRKLSPRQRAWRVGLFIVVAGPLIGTLLTFVVMLIANGWGREGAGKPFALVELLQVAAMLALFGFIFGGLPALLSAAWLARRTFLRGGFGYLEAIATAVVATILGNVLFATMLGEFRNPFTSGVSFVPVGVASALVVRWMLGRLGWIAHPR